MSSSTEITVGLFCAMDASVQLPCYFKSLINMIIHFLQCVTALPQCPTHISLPLKSHRTGLPLAWGTMPHSTAAVYRQCSSVGQGNMAQVLLSWFSTSLNLLLNSWICMQGSMVLLQVPDPVAWTFTGCH